MNCVALHSRRTKNFAGAAVMRLSAGRSAEFSRIKGNDRRHSRFRNRGRILDNEICVRPSPSGLRKDIPDRRATTMDAFASSSTVERKRLRAPLPGYCLGAAARAAAVEALVAGAVANHDRATVGAGRGVLLALKTDLDRAGFDGRGLCRRDGSCRRSLNLDDWLSADDADRLLLRPAEEFRGEPAEDVVGDGLGDRDFRVLREARRLEAGMREFLRSEEHTSELQSR